MKKLLRICCLAVTVTFAATSSGQVTDKKSLFETSDTLLIKTLVQQGQRIDETNPSGNTPLLDALLKKDQDKAKVLIDLGASLSVLNADGWTPLQLAVYLSEQDCVKRMLGRNAEVNKQSTNGWTALHYAVRENNAPLVLLLLDAGARRDIADKWGRTPLSIATERDFTYLQNLLK